MRILYPEKLVKKKLRPTVSIIHIRTHNHNHNHQLPPPPPPPKQICSCCHLVGTLLLPPRRNSILTPPYPITAHYCVAAPITPTTQGFQSRLFTLHGRSSEPSRCLRSGKLLPHHPHKVCNHHAPLSEGQLSHAQSRIATLPLIPIKYQVTLPCEAWA